jgi:hypothetical protein
LIPHVRTLVRLLIKSNQVAIDFNNFCLQLQDIPFLVRDFCTGEIRRVA